MKLKTKETSDVEMENNEESNLIEELNSEKIDSMLVEYKKIIDALKVVLKTIDSDNGNT